MVNVKFAHIFRLTTLFVMNYLRTFLLLSVLLVSACSSRGLVKSGLDLDKSDTPLKILVVTPDFQINEIGFGKTQERVVEWEENAGKTFEQSVVNLTDKDKAFEVVSTRDLDESTQKNLMQHRALFATMAPQILQIKEGAVDVWAKESKNFQYTLGPGLSSLKDSQGIDVALFVIGKDTIRSASRIALDMINTIIPGAKTLSSEKAYLIASIVDVKTGDILLFDYDAAKRKELSKQSDVKAMADEVLTDYKRLIKKKTSWF